MTPTPIIDAVRAQRGDYIAAVESLERSHARLFAVCERAAELIASIRPEKDSDADTLGQAENYLDSAIAAARGGPA